MNLSEKILNPRKYAIRKWLSDIMGNRYVPHDPIVERVSASLTTNKDGEDFGKFVMAVYEAGYAKCLNDYKEKLEAMGIKVSMSSNQN